MTDWLLDHSKAVYRCPRCHEADMLCEFLTLVGDEDYDETEAWRDIVVKAGPGGEQVVERAREIHTENRGRLFEGRGYFEHDLINSGDWGCGHCGWDSSYASDPDCLEYHAPALIGWDGKKIPAPLEGQLRLEET